MNAYSKCSWSRLWPGGALRQENCHQTIDSCTVGLPIRFSQDALIKNPPKRKLRGQERGEIIYPTEHPSLAALVGFRSSESVRR